MPIFRNMNGAFRSVCTVVAIPCTTFILNWAHAQATAAAMVFLMLVVGAATYSGIVLSLSTALLCSLSFDYFFLPPLHTLRLAGLEECSALVAFVGSCLIVSRIAELARNQTRQAEGRREDVERLYELSQEMMLNEDAAGLVSDLPRMIQRVFALREVVLYVRDQDQFFCSCADIGESMQAHLRMLTLGLNPTLVGKENPASVALNMGLRPIGALGWQLPLLSREIASAVGAQVAIAITRATAMEASARMEAAREGERLRAALIDSLTHELKTPLTSIRAAATTLLQSGPSLDEETRSDLALIVDEEAAHLAALIGEAVEMAEIDADVLKVHAVLQHPRALIDQALEESRKILSVHRISVEMEEPLSPAWFDPHLLGRVFRHILENAARYTPSGGRISVKSFQRNGRLSFVIEDSGPGIDSGDLPLIFEKFYRGRKTARKGKGTGMGLAITRSILSVHGGGIEAISSPGKGARFHFWIPLVERQPEQDN